MGPLWDGKERRVEDEDRRKICYLHQSTIDEIKADIVANQEAIHDIETIKIPMAETFRGQAKIAGFIASLVWLLGFTYTYNHKLDSVREHSNIRSEVRRNTSGLSEMQGDHKALLVEVRSLVREIEKSNDLTQQFIEALKETKK